MSNPTSKRFRSFLCCYKEDEVEFKEKPAQQLKLISTLQFYNTKSSEILDVSQKNENENKIKEEDKAEIKTQVQKPPIQLSNSQIRGYDNQGEKIAASSLECGKIDQLRKVAEKKQAKENQLILSKVKQQFELNKVFLLRDFQNKYHSLAYSTQHFFKIPQNQVVMQSQQANAAQNILANAASILKVANTGLNKNIYNVMINSTDSSSSSELFTHLKVAVHISEIFSKFNLIIEVGCGLGHTTIQLAKTTKMVLAIDNQFDLLQQCAENVSSYIHEKSINVEYLCSDFLQIEKGLFSGIERADGVLIHVRYNFNPLSVTDRVDIFKNSNIPLIETMEAAYRLSKNIAVVFPFFIDIDQFPVLLDKFFECFQGEQFEHNCAHIQVIYLNNNVSCYLILIGQISSISQDDEFKFLQQKIQQYSYYPRGPYESRVLELLQRVKQRKGMKKLVNTLVKVLDQDFFQVQKNLLSHLVDELVKNKIMNDQEISEILNFSKTIQTTSNLEQPDLNIELRGSGLGYYKNNEFPSQSGVSGSSSFQIELEYGSQQQSNMVNSNKINNNNNNHSSAGSYSNAKSNGYSESIQNSQYKYEDSSLGDQLQFHESYDDEFNSYQEQSEKKIKDNNISYLNGRNHSLDEVENKDANQIQQNNDNDVFGMKWYSKKSEINTL